MTAETQAQRKHTEVAVGVLLRESDGALLISSRPAGKPYAGYWEFPGGKLEAGESVEEALRRELIEELGVTIGQAHAWKVTEHDYPHALVRLHWCKVTQWTGEFEMREGQQMAWQQLPLDVHPVLPGSYPVLQWLSEEHPALFEAFPEPVLRCKVRRFFQVSASEETSQSALLDHLQDEAE